MNQWKLIPKNKLSEIARAIESIDILAEKWNLPVKIAFNLHLAIEYPTLSTSTIYQLLLLPYEPHQ